MLLRISNTMKNGTFLCDLVPKLKCTYQRNIIALDHCVSCRLYQSVTCTTAIAFCVHIGQARGAFLFNCVRHTVIFTSLTRTWDVQLHSIHSQCTTTNLWENKEERNMFLIRQCVDLFVPDVFLVFLFRFFLENKKLKIKKPDKF